MAVRPVQRLAAAPVIALTLLLAGCSSEPAGPDAGASAQPDPSTSTPPANAAEWTAYYGCLEDEGLVLQKRDDGKSRLNKEVNSDEEIKAAEKKCAALLPDPRPVADAALQESRELSACMRENGFPDYPDPDPQTGDVELSQEAMEKFKHDPDALAARKKCTPRGTSSQAPAAE